MIYSIALSFFFIGGVMAQLIIPDQYRFTRMDNNSIVEHYAIDQTSGRMSRIWYSHTGDEKFGGNQDIFIRNDARTYSFDFMADPPQCIANRGGPYNEMNYWPNLVQYFGGESKPNDGLILDEDCGGVCLTWTVIFNMTHEYNYQQISRLYVKKSEQKPIKLVSKTYNLDTKQLIDYETTRFIDWTTGPVPDYEFDYPMDLKKCFYV